MNEPRIRAARGGDVPAIANIVDQAYRHYIARIGRLPGPMLDDYPARVSEGVVWVVEEGAVIGADRAGARAELSAPDNIAVSPARQGLGLGRRLLAFAEDEALRRGLLRWCISPKPYCVLSITCFIPVSEARTIASSRR